MRRPLVLLVDRDEDTRDIFRTALEWHGYGVLHTGEPESGLELCVRQRPDLILGDFPLPMRDGTNFIEAVRSDPQVRDTPIVVVTARAMRSEVKLARSLGDLVLLKPIVPADLVDEVKRLIGPGASGRDPDDRIPPADA